MICFTQYGQQPVFIDTMLGWATETWETMARSGLTMVFYGAESGDERALLAMDKGGLTVNDTVEPAIVLSRPSAWSSAGPAWVGQSAMRPATRSSQRSNSPRWMSGSRA